MQTNTRHVAYAVVLVALGVALAPFTSLPIGIARVKRLRSRSLTSECWRATWREALADPAQQQITQLTIGVEPLLSGSLGKGRIRHVPELELAGAVARELDGLVLRLWRQRDDEIEVVVFEIVEAAAAMTADIDAEFIQRCYGKSIDFAAGPHAGALDEDLAAMQILHQRLGHRRTDLVHGASKEHGTRQVVAHRRQGTATTAMGRRLRTQMQHADECEEPPGRIAVHADLIGHGLLQ